LSSLPSFSFLPSFLPSISSPSFLLHFFFPSVLLSVRPSCLPSILLGYLLPYYVFMLSSFRSSLLHF
jgi:hypothetical protein